MPTIWKRLGMFMLMKYFSMRSPSSLCAPAVTPPGLVHRFGELLPANAPIGEGIDPLLHLAEHLLPQRDWVADLVGHTRPPHPP